MRESPHALRSHPEEPAQVPAPGSLMAGRYTVLEVLGEGGMGVVLAAYDARLDRRVALKLLRSQAYASTSESEARMLREAQAMARLSHPNVVTVYDAGVLQAEGSIFIAMELVLGQTLRSWCAQPRTPHEILEAYVAAGRGLAAAHQAGLIHRDFKPDNVLVGEDGRVRVTDFGVARANTLRLHDPPVPLPPSTQLGTWETPLTQPGLVMGTPKYLAPELFEGAPADSRSDLFAFCMALYEALYGQPPFSGDTWEERAQAMWEGRITPPPAQTQVPRWVARAVLSGLATDPKARPASMQALLATLEKDPAQKRLGRLLAVVTGMGVGVLVGLSLNLGQAAPWRSECAGMERRLEGVWDEPVRSKVRAAFLGTGLSYAQGTYESVDSTLRDYANAWVSQRSAVCEVIQKQGSRPSSLAVLEEQCLERRHHQLRALTRLLAQDMDSTLLPQVTEVLRSLPPLAYCADEKALLAAVPPPEEPELRKRVEALQPEVERLRLLHPAGRYQEGLSLGNSLLERSESMDYPPLRAHLLYQLGRLLDGAGDYPAAELRLRESIRQAARGKDDLLAAKGWIALTAVVGTRQRRIEAALDMELAVEAAVERADNDEARVFSLNNLGSLLEQKGQYDEAQALFERALAIQEKTLGSDDLGTANVHINLAILNAEKGRFEEAQAYFERALAIQRKVLPPEHPELLGLLSNLGILALHLGRYEQARSRIEESLALQEKQLGPEHPYVAANHNNLGLALAGLGRFQEARGHHERALFLYQKLRGPEDVSLGVVFSALGSVLLELGQNKEARAHLTRALAITAKTLGPEHPENAGVLETMGRALEALGRHEEARVRFQRALAIQEKARGPEHPATALTRGYLGRALLHLGRLEAASRHLESALAQLRKAPGEQDPSVHVPLMGLGELRLLQGRPDEAVELLESALPLAQGVRRAAILKLLARARGPKGPRRKAHPGKKADGPPQALNRTRAPF